MSEDLFVRPFGSARAAASDAAARRAQEQARFKPAPTLSEGLRGPGREENRASVADFTTTHLPDPIPPQVDPEQVETPEQVDPEIIQIVPVQIEHEQIDPTKRQIHPPQIEPKQIEPVQIDPAHIHHASPADSRLRHETVVVGCTTIHLAGRSV